MRMQTDIGELVKDKRVIIGAVVAVLLVGGGITAYELSSGGNAPDAATLPATGSGPPPAPLAAGGAPAGPPSAPGAPIASATKASGSAPITPINVPNSFVGEPASMGGGAAGGGQGAPAPGGPPVDMTAATGVPAPGGGAGSAGAKPAPIAPGRKAQLARVDPFEPFLKLIVDQIPAYTLIVPQRMAMRPTPPPLPPILSPELRFGPLPPVERRVAGVLFDGSVSAILETGTPGSASTEVQVIQPGSMVHSGVPNIEDLTVASISPSSILLRAQDGRTTTVRLSNVSAQYADSFHNAANGPGISQGGAPGPGGGFPGPGGGPPGRGGAGGPGAFAP